MGTGGATLGGTLRTVAGGCLIVVCGASCLIVVCGTGFCRRGTLRSAAGCWEWECEVHLVDWGIVWLNDTLRGLLRGKGVGWLGLTLSRMVVSVFNMATVLGSRGARLLAGAGFFRAWTMSLMPARIISVEEARGIGISCGNQETVSQMRVPEVDQM